MLTAIARLADPINEARNQIQGSQRNAKQRQVTQSIMIVLIEHSPCAPPCPVQYYRIGRVPHTGQTRRTTGPVTLVTLARTLAEPMGTLSIISLTEIPIFLTKYAAVLLDILTLNHTTLLGSRYGRYIPIFIENMTNHQD